MPTPNVVQAVGGDVYAIGLLPFGSAALGGFHPTNQSIEQCVVLFEHGTKIVLIDVPPMLRLRYDIEDMAIAVFIPSTKMNCDSVLIIDSKRLPLSLFARKGITVREATTLDTLCVELAGRDPFFPNLDDFSLNGGTHVRLS